MSDCVLYPKSELCVSVNREQWKQIENTYAPGFLAWDREEIEETVNLLANGEWQWILFRTPGRLRRAVFEMLTSVGIDWFTSQAKYLKNYANNSETDTLENLICEVFRHPLNNTVSLAEFIRVVGPDKILNNSDRMRALARCKGPTDALAEIFTLDQLQKDEFNFHFCLKKAISDACDTGNAATAEFLFDLFKKYKTQEFENADGQRATVWFRKTLRDATKTNNLDVVRVIWNAHEYAREDIFFITVVNAKNEYPPELYDILATCGVIRERFIRVSSEDPPLEVTIDFYSSSEARWSRELNRYCETVHHLPFDDFARNRHSKHYALQMLVQLTIDYCFGMRGLFLPSLVVAHVVECVPGVETIFALVPSARSRIYDLIARINELPVIREQKSKK